MTGFFVIKKNEELKAGDVIEVSMSIDPQIPEEDYEKHNLNLDDYDIKYNISYIFPHDMGCGDVDFLVEAGYCPSFGDDIKSYIEESVHNDIKELDDYEIFDVDNSSFEYQTAKIRVKSLK